MTDTPEMPDVIKFLLGEGELDGCWFGDGTSPPFTSSRPYWWRKALREYVATRTPEIPANRWLPIETHEPPRACHFLTAYFYEEGGEWIYDIASWHNDHVCGVGDGSGPWTHWQPLPAPPGAEIPASDDVVEKVADARLGELYRPSPYKE